MISKKYRDKLEINRDDLEGEWIEQSSHYGYYAEAHADAVYERDQAKTKLELVECELDNNLINNWEKFFTKFPSEQMRRNKIVTHEKYKSAIAKFDKSNHTVNLLQAAKQSFDHRGRALGGLVTLLVNGIRSDPRVIKRTLRREETKHVGLKKGATLKRKKD